MQRKHYDYRTSTAALSTTEGQAVWQPGGAEEDSRFREGDRHLCLAYDEEEEDYCATVVVLKGFQIGLEGSKRTRVPNAEWKRVSEL